MPQLDFTWWLINFLLVWLSILVVLALITTSKIEPGNESPLNILIIEKETTEWQWA